jgi:hypothetical protein
MRELEAMVDDWIHRKIRSRGYLPGLRGQPGEPMDLAGVKKAGPMIWRAIYTNTSTIFPLLTQILNYPNALSEVSVQRLQLYDGLLVQEYTWRLMLLSRGFEVLLPSYLTIEDEIQKFAH